MKTKWLINCMRIEYVWKPHNGGDVYWCADKKNYVPLTNIRRVSNSTIGFIESNRSAWKRWFLFDASKETKFLFLWWALFRIFTCIWSWLYCLDYTTCILSQHQTVTITGIFYCTILCKGHSQGLKVSQLWNASHKRNLVSVETKSNACIEMKKRNELIFHGQYDMDCGGLRPTTMSLRNHDGNSNGNVTEQKNKWAEQ